MTSGRLTFIRVDTLGLGIACVIQEAGDFILLLGRVQVKIQGLLISGFFQPLLALGH